MAANGGRHRLGPDSGRLTLRTYRSGLAAQAGHDLTIDVTRWSGQAGPDRLDVTVDLNSLEVREGLGGVVPLTDRDRRDIAGKARKQLDTGRYPEASYTATAFTEDDAGGGTIDGTLTLHGRSRPLRLQVRKTGDGRYRVTASVVQSEFGIKPYSGMLGALKVRDDVDVEVSVELTADGPS
ncbi:MAG: YceI family protein [Actinobacteria bacterium]|nr:YceI family protein [Actinomycetota bacterium]